MITTPEDLARFWSLVERQGPEECWIWKGPVYHVHHDYGTFQRQDDHGKRRVDQAHRVAWELLNGSIAEGRHLLNTCGQTLCCNPTHWKPRLDELTRAPYQAEPGTFLHDIKEWLEWMEWHGERPKTIATYSGAMRQFADWLSEHHPEIRAAEGLTKRIWTEYSMSRLGASVGGMKPLSRTGMNKVGHILKSFLHYCRTEAERPRVLDEDMITMPRTFSSDKARRHVATPEEVGALLSLCDLTTARGRRDDALIRVLFASGMRVDELHRANRADFPIEGLGTEDLFGVQVCGKGMKIRTIYLDRRTQAALRDYLLDRDDQATALFVAIHAGRGGGYRPEGERLSARAIQLTLRELSARAGLPVTLTPHTLRHGMAVDILEGGAELRGIQELLGHSSIATTQIYTQVSNRFARETYLKRRGLDDQEPTPPPTPATSEAPRLRLLKPAPNPGTEHGAALDALTTAKLLGHRIYATQGRRKGELEKATCALCGMGLAHDQGGALAGPALTEACPGARAARV